MQAKPNILLIFTDMQRADTIQTLGNPVIKTPNLDRLAREGTSFTSCYSPSPVCIPARCSMHYGLYPTRTGLAVNGRMMDHNGTSLPEQLQTAGYFTGAIGKCHFTPDRDALRGFEMRLKQEANTSRGIPATDDYINWLIENGFDAYEPHGARGEMYYIPQVSTLPAEAHPSQWVGDRCIDFMDEHNDKPWMLFSSFIHPHPPFAPPKPWHKLYRGPDMPLPFVPDQTERLHTAINRKQNRYKYRDNGLDRNLLRQIKAYYYATISFVDYQIGRMLAALEAKGELDNTLILFTSDHGELLGDYNCFGKRSMHDPSSRIPLLIRYPERFSAGQRCITPASLVDILPTCCAAAGIDLVGVDTDGQDLTTIADATSNREFVYSQHGHNEMAQYMAVTEDWKYFYSVADRREFLFDRKGDPHESRNCAATPSRRERTRAMRTKLLSFLQAKGLESAYTEDGRGDLVWREHPVPDESYLGDPDAGLLFQDTLPEPFAMPGYTDG